MSNILAQESELTLIEARDLLADCVKQANTDEGQHPFLFDTMSLKQARQVLGAMADAVLDDEAARLRAYRQARIFEPSADGYHAAMSVYSAAFGKPDGEPTVILPNGDEKQGWDLDGLTGARR